ncbi:DUF551 domain-containing protein [Escherichia coli]|nr:DUF551 domain-containing protein [Escherichia coli]MGE45769.1 DUF551 domain-containing protein [Escherichia coli]MGR50512.1 DUF551 domain-containing protein [Escherichia coli]
MSTITREWLQQAINDYESVRDELPFGLDDYQGNILAALRIALASLEAEPIGFRCRRNDNLGDWSYVYHREPDDFERKHLVIEGIYAAPPAPVSVPAAMEIDDDFDSAFEHGKAVGWNAYRAAMLQAEPVSNSDELPLDYLQGHKDGLEWAAQLAEANHPQTGDWLYDDPIDLARAIRKGPGMPTVQAGNSPVIQDGWISCSERMPEKYDFDIWVFSPSRGVLDGLQWDGSMFTDDEYQFVIHDATHWMRKAYPAAPQQDGE